jgi:recombination protein RecR
MYLLWLRPCRAVKSVDYIPLLYGYTALCESVDKLSETCVAGVACSPARAQTRMPKRIDYPAALKRLIGELKRMPGIGPRSAERIALWMIQRRDARTAEIARAIAEVTAEVRPCARCGFFATEALCEICADEARDATQLCVVENATDVLPIERTGVFKGRYHTLGGRISPLEHIGPEHLRIEPLLERVRAEAPAEVILALGSDVEGEATASYLAELLRELPVSLTRIAQGLPAGGGLEFADELTVSRALAGRRKIERPG